MACKRVIVFLLVTAVTVAVPTLRQEDTEDSKTDVTDTTDLVNSSSPTISTEDSDETSECINGGVGSGSPSDGEREKSLCKNKSQTVVDEIGDSKYETKSEERDDAISDEISKKNNYSTKVEKLERECYMPINFTIFYTE